MSSKLSFTETFLKAKNQHVTKEEIKKQFHLIWYNTRSKNTGYRLTDYGLDLIQEADIRTYEIKLPNNFKITGQILVWFDRQLISPYHLNENVITVLTEIAALEIHLFSGDIQKMGLAKSLANRLSQ